MNEMLHQQLRLVTRSILDSSRPAYSLRSEVLELKSIFQQAGGETLGDPQIDIAAGETKTSVGVAISPAMAALCVDDYARTVQFIRGIHDAIFEVRKTINARPIRILYAGCGPWATLAVPLISTFSPDEVSFTLLDIHEDSIRSVEKIVVNLGLSNHVAQLIRSDAGEYEIPPDEAPDIIVIEMIRAALEAEPQVAVARHLVGQAPQAVIIPEEIRVDLALVNQSREFTVDADTNARGEVERERVSIGTVIALNKKALSSWENSRRSRFQVPEFDEMIYRPMLLTTIRVFREHCLADYDSGITCPRALQPDLKLNPGETIEFSYELTGRPGLRAVVV